MAKKQGKENHKCIVVSLRHVATPDVQERLSRELDILCLKRQEDAPLNQRQAHISADNNQKIFKALGEQPEVQGG